MVCTKCTLDKGKKRCKDCENSYARERKKKIK